MENNGIALNYNEKKMSNLTLKKITNKKYRYLTFLLVSKLKNWI